MTLLYNKLVNCPWTKEKTEKTLRPLWKKLGLKGDVEINVVGDSAIRQLNLHYRNIDKVTDVLSFAWSEDKQIPSRMLGQIYICYPQIARQAKACKVTVKEEYVRILAHGLLHVAGYDHCTKPEAGKMFALQEWAVKKLTI